MQRIQVGIGSRRDPILAYSTVMAAELLKVAVKRGITEPVAWLRGELNKVNPGDGDDFVKKARMGIVGGKNADQSMFDALRLTIANRLATAADRIAPMHSASGLGDSSADIRSVFCGVMGTATVGGSVYTGASSNAERSTAIGQAGSAAMSAYGCNQQMMDQSTMRAQADAQAAVAALSMRQESRDRLLIVGGVTAGVVVLGLVAIMAMRK
jgi:hypothetical protein